MTQIKLGKCGFEHQPKVKCKVCRDIYMAAYRKANAHKIKVRHQQYCAENAKDIAKYRKEYQEDNKPWILEWKKNDREENKEAIRNYMAEYRKTNADKFEQYNSNRRIATHSKVVGFRNEFIISEIYALRKLRQSILGVKLTVDHIVPLVSKYVCGLHWEKNLQIITYLENSSKGNRWWPDMPVYTAQDKHELEYYKWLYETIQTS